METIRQVVAVDADRQLHIDLPDTIQPGLVEVVIVVQSISATPPDQLSPSSPPANLFGFLPKRVDLLKFQQQLRNEASPPG